ncbi:hypothetical protein SPSYN_01026 [Sporotomaculum syntrophicum]|uniref:DUF2292 domain-containing protein n=1 Tax=Sporotomaculum syntrophicum TaxID=182264 RepID=A0A9D3AZW0_9FIRM|nr:hypothetical protein SPSYN_01026 [Sporotomaculum syntrophicum]
MIHVNKKIAEKETIPAVLQQKIIAAIKSLKFGSVNIIVQDGQIIQIEKLEKERFK